MMRDAPGQQKIIEYLHQYCRRLAASGERRLPPLREVSRSQGVAYVTVVKAVRQLCRAGVLRSLRGSGTCVVGEAIDCLPEPVDTAPPVASRTWQRVADELRKDLLQGIHAAGEVLPPAKQLIRSFGVSRPTLRKALERLRVEGVLQPHGLGYRAAVPGSSRSRGSVLLLARGAHDLSRLSPRAQELYRVAQGECARARVGLHLVFYDYDRAGTLALNREDRAMLEDPYRFGLLGFLLFERGFAEESALVVAQSSIRSGLALSVLCETGSYQPGIFETMGRLCREFSISYLPLCGEMVARYLLGLGHRRIAYICVSPAAVWSRNRLEGIRRTYAQAGYGDGVLACVAARPTEALSREALGEGIVPLLHAALEDREASAWVASNDAVAIHCRRFLAHRGVAVPEQISLIGFDDTLDAFLWDISSYNHNMHAVLRAMLAHVLQPRGYPRPKGPRRPMEIAGFVTERRTTGARRKVSQ